MRRTACLNIEIREVSVIPKPFADFVAQDESEIGNIQISDSTDR